MLEMQTIYINSLIVQTLGTSSVRGFLFVGERYHMRGVTGLQLFIPLTNLIE
jgi:hypothetical protein